MTESAEAFGPMIQQQWLAVLSFPDAYLLKTGAVSSHLLVFPVPKAWGYTEQTGCGLHSICCQVIQNLFVLPVFGAEDPRPHLGPMLCAALEK